MLRRGRCNPDEEILFSHLWEGTEAGCLHTSVHYDDWVDTVEENNAYNNRVPKNSQRRCSPIYAREPILENTFFGQKICGRRGGDPFVTVTRVNSEGKCPEGTAACSNKTSAEDTICYPARDLSEKCPINALKFISFQEITQASDFVMS